MRGVVYIERENTAGDRRIVRKLDVEGFPNALGDPMEIVKQAVRDALAEPAVYRVRALHDYDLQPFGRGERDGAAADHGRTNEIDCAHCFCRSKTVPVDALAVKTKRVRYCCWCGEEKS